MSQTSPILRFALEVLHHALENYVSDKPRLRKIAVLSLAQAVELTIKAALVEQNVPIYQKNGRTINSHDALACLAALWNLERVPYHARIELLIDERNAIQHRYGNVDEVSLDYHLETAFEVIAQILRADFDTELGQWVRDTLDESVWNGIRFLDVAFEPSEEEHASEPSDSVRPERSPVVEFVAGFASFEKSIRGFIAPFLFEGQRFTGSTLDFCMKALSNAEEPAQELLRTLPDVYRLRNRSVHGDEEPNQTEVRRALEVLDKVIAALLLLPESILERAARASMRGVRGTHLPSRLEEAQEEFAAQPPNEPQSSDD